MIMERTSRLAAARERQQRYAAELDAQIAAKNRSKGGTFAGRRCVVCTVASVVNVLPDKTGQC